MILDRRILKSREQVHDPSSAGPLPVYSLTAHEHYDRYTRIGNNSFSEAGTPWYTQDGGYAAALRMANARGEGGIVPQPIIWHPTSYRKPMGIVVSEWKRQTFPANRIRYTGAMPMYNQPTVNKPAPWNVPPYTPPPFAPPGAL